MGAQSDKRRANGVPMCGGTNRAGEPCGNTAGFRTPHAGWGNCAFHGGCTPAGEAHAAKLQAQAEAGRLGAEAPLDPGDALTLAVRLIGGEVEYLRRKLREADENGTDARLFAGAFAAAVERLARIGKLATDAGIDERRLELDSPRRRPAGCRGLGGDRRRRPRRGRPARLDAALRQRLGELSDDDLRTATAELAA